MKKIILVLTMVIFLASTLIAIQEPLIYYKLNLDYNYGDISISSTEIEFSNEEIENFFGIYTLEILDFNDELLDLVFFDVPNEILWDGVDSETGEISIGGLLELNETSFEIFVPYYENAKEIIIYNENLTELTKVRVNEFSKIREDVEEIPYDIEIGDKIISEKENLLDNLSQYWYVFLIILIVLVIVLFYSIGKKK